MVILIVLLILWAPYAVTKLVLRAQHARVPTTAHPQMRAELPSGAGTAAGGQDVPGWSALDDRQLTRLLNESAP